jgi:DNA-binding IclR family transcriptional regulator
MSDTVKSARRGLEVFEFSARTRRPAGVKEVAEAPGHPQSSASVLLRSLATPGDLSHDWTGRTLCPTLRLRSLVHRMPAEVEEVRRRFGTLRVPAEETGHTVTPGLRIDLRVLCLTVTDATDPENFRLSPGRLRPLCRTGIGIALLGLRSDREVRAIAPRIMPERPDRKPVPNPETVLEAVGRARQCGHALSCGWASPGAGAASCGQAAAAVANAIRDATGLRIRTLPPPPSRAPEALRA